MHYSKPLKFLTIVALVFIFGCIGFLIGPQPETPAFDRAMPIVPAEPHALEHYIAAQESRHKIKPGNEAKIIWCDSAKQKTPYSIVYLHGFSASQKEGDPVHRRLARTFGCNLYLSRLADHGIDTTDALQLFTADRVWNTAKEALAIASAIGEKVLIVSTSTGSTLALKLAATYPDQVDALINLSPNIAINNPAAFLLNDPWGLQIARMVTGGKYRLSGASAEKSKYWNNKYRLEAVIQLEELIESSMKEETFKAVKQPSLTLYYYKNANEQDTEVKVEAMLEMHALLGTPDNLKRIKPIPTAGAHVLGGALVSKDIESVYAEMENFAVEVIQMPRHKPCVREGLANSRQTPPRD